MPDSGSEELLERLGRVGSIRFRTEEKTLLPGERVAFIRDDREEGYIQLHTIDGGIFEPVSSFRELTRKLEGRFILCHGYYLVNVEKVRAVSGAPGRFRLHFRRPRVSVPISDRYEGNVKELFGVSTLEHLVPSHPEERFLRLHGLIDFGYRELMDLDRADRQAVRAFKRRWTLARFTYERIRRYFKQVTTDRIDTVRFTRNAIWQTKRWIEWGIEDLYDGDLRTYWYGVRRSLRRHTEVIESVSGDSFNGILNRMILKEKLFTYSEIGFFDLRSPYRRMGTRHPATLVIGEKQGHFNRLLRVAEPRGCGVACLKGYPAHISLEYLAAELAEHGVSAETTDRLDLVLVVDFDWDGKQIGETFIKMIKIYTGIENVRVRWLVRLEDVTDEVLEYGRAPAARYYRQRGRYVPFDDETTPRKIETARKWLEWLGDPRFFSRDRIGDKWVYTIWKISVDGLDWREGWRDRLDEILGELVEDGLQEQDLVRALEMPPARGISPVSGPKRGEKHQKGLIRRSRADWEAPWAESGVRGGRSREWRPRGLRLKWPQEP